MNHSREVNNRDLSRPIFKHLIDSPGSHVMASVTQRSDAFSKFASLKNTGANQYASQILGGTKATLDHADSTFRGTHV